MDGCAGAIVERPVGDQSLLVALKVFAEVGL
jgi:hypothetical protein